MFIKNCGSTSELHHWGSSDKVSCRNKIYMCSCRNEKYPLIIMNLTLSCLYQSTFSTQFHCSQLAITTVLHTKAFNVLLIIRDQTCFFCALTLARTRKRCWKPCAKPQSFQHLLGTDHYCCIISKFLLKLAKIWQDMLSPFESTISAPSY